MVDKNNLNEWLMHLTNVAVVVGIVFLASPNHLCESCNSGRPAMVGQDWSASYAP